MELILEIANTSYMYCFAADYLTDDGDHV